MSMMSHFSSSLDSAQVTAIAGGIALVLAAVLLWYYNRSKKLLDEMWAVDTYDARELRRMCSGGFRATVEVQGNVTCDKPVTAPASTSPAAGAVLSSSARKHGCAPRGAGFARSRSG